MMLSGEAGCLPDFICPGRGKGPLQDSPEGLRPILQPDSQPAQHKALINLERWNRNEKHENGNWEHLQIC